MSTDPVLWNVLPFIKEQFDTLSPVVKGIVAPKAAADKPSSLQFLKAFDGFHGCILDRLSSLSIALQTFVAERHREAVYNLHTFIEYSYQSHKPRKILSGLLFQFTRKDVHGPLYNASLKHCISLGCMYSVAPFWRGKWAVTEL